MLEVIAGRRVFVALWHAELKHQVMKQAMDVFESSRLRVAVCAEIALAKEKLYQVQ